MDSSIQWSELVTTLQRDNAAIDAAFMTGQLGTKIKELANDAREQFEGGDTEQHGEEGSGVPTS